jgi:hypothetical protein
MAYVLNEKQSDVHGGTQKKVNETINWCRKIKVLKLHSNYEIN